MAVGIDHGYVLGRKTFDRARHQLRNGLLRLRREHAAAGLEDDRRFGGPLLLAEERLPRQHQMHPHALHLAQGLQGALQLAFEGALVVHLLGKIRACPVRGIEKLEAHTRPRGRPWAAVSKRLASSWSAGTNKLPPSEDSW